MPPPVVKLSPLLNVLLPVSSDVHQFGNKQTGVARCNAVCIDIHGQVYTKCKPIQGGHMLADVVLKNLLDDETNVLSLLINNM